MSLRIAIQMDRPTSLNLAGDSTIALAEEAQRRGHALWHYHPSALAWHGGKLYAQQAHSLRIISGMPPSVETGAAQSLCLNETDLVLMRQDPPFDMAYLSATYLLERLPDTTRVLNDPAYVRNHPEKIAILDFAEWIPPTLISADPAAIVSFRQSVGTVVVKPLYGFGGHSVYRFTADDPNLDTLLEEHRLQHQEPLMIQAFLPEVASQDVRVILMHGRISGVLGRIPPEGAIRANLRAGGTAATTSLSPRQQQIAETVGVHLSAHGIAFAGLDLIGDYLTEINITSPTGIRAIQALSGHNAAIDFWDGVESGA